jgi:hypothetical protein
MLKKKDFNGVDAAKEKFQTTVIKTKIGAGLLSEIRTHNWPSRSGGYIMLASLLGPTATLQLVPTLIPADVAGPVVNSVLMLSFAPSLPGTNPDTLE